MVVLLVAELALWWVLGLMKGKDLYLERLKASGLVNERGTAKGLERAFVLALNS
jgi:hypothetical protein